MAASWTIWRSGSDIGGLGQSPAEDFEIDTNIYLEFLVRPHGIFIGGRLSAPLAVVKVLKTLDLRCAQAATAIAGGPVERTGPDFR